MEYSYTKESCKDRRKTYLTITVKDKETGNPISDAFVTLAIEHTPYSLRDNISTCDNINNTCTRKMCMIKTQTMYTDNGHTTFTVQLGPKSDV